MKFLLTASRPKAQAIPIRGSRTITARSPSLQHQHQVKVTSRSDITETFGVQIRHQLRTKQLNIHINKASAWMLVPHSELIRVGANQSWDTTVMETFQYSYQFIQYWPWMGSKCFGVTSAAVYLLHIQDQDLYDIMTACQVSAVHKRSDQNPHG